jgi:hypothetical protein
VKERIEAPADLLDVLNAALAALASDKRFRNCPGGHYDISWCQPTYKKDDARPARYRIAIECRFVP